MDHEKWELGPITGAVEADDTLVLLGKTLFTHSF